MRSVAWSFRASAVVARMVVGVLVAAWCSGCASAEGPRRGEQILFAPSVASVSDADHWLVRIQGRIFEPAEDSRRRQALIDVLARSVGASRTDPIYRARAGNLVSDSIRNARISVALGDQVVRVGPSDPAGYFSADVSLTNDQVAQLARGGVLTFESLPTRSNASRFSGSAILVAQDGVIVVTDMDDTIKDTNVNNRAEARANTLQRPFRPVTGMPELYRAWAEADPSRIHFHVVSAGPWQFHEPLRRFTQEAGFPAFTWDMRSVDTTEPATVVEETVKADPQRLFDFKISAIRALMARFPKRHVVLVGDSGERDPETYATILSEFADRVDAVFIRNVTGQSKDAPRYTALFPSPAAAARLQVFEHASDLPRRLPGAAQGNAQWSPPATP